MRINLVLNAIQACHQQRCIAEIRITGSIRVPQFKAAQFRRLGIGGNADHRAAIAGGIAYGNRCLKPWHQTLEGVGTGVGNGAERMDVLEESAHKIMGLPAQMRITVVIRKHRLSILQQQHMDMHAAARFSINGLGHQGSTQAVLLRGIMDDILDHHGSIRHL